MRKNRVKQYAYRWGFGSSPDWVSDPLESYGGQSINNSSDVVGQTTSLEGFLHHSGDGGTYAIKDLVNDADFDSAGLGFLDVLERDDSMTTPAPVIICNVEWSDQPEKIAILIPEDVPAP